ncbi:MAG: MerR family transcriptional regulator [Oscillospiraceae bacterium]|nr:MerR family transcriptional regulator [Oscillospiraceae bacterium]
MKTKKNASGALMSIKDFSQASGVEQSTLRYWDSLGLFSPAVRDEHSRYRYYSSQQVASASFIKVLSNLKIPLKVMLELKDKRTPESVLQILEHRQVTLCAELNQLSEAIATTHTLCDNIRRGIAAPDPGTGAAETMEAIKAFAEAERHKALRA